MSPRRWPSLLAPLALALVFVLVALSPRLARAETSGQYLVVIDDSGSMNQSDPDRLVMMASLALGAALGDTDQVMIAGLNQLASGELDRARFVSPRELLAQRDGAEGRRTLDGPQFETMARHGGGTPCRAALVQARAILEEVASAGAPQTLLLLTDGACTGGVDPAGGWLAGVTSHGEDRFRFALLTQGDQRVDPALAAYAKATGWTADPSVNFDSRSLLRAFAEVLSFSRGLRFDGGGVDVSRTFAGAREVRALAISSEGRSPIAIALTDDSMDSRVDSLSGGPTFVHGEYGWSLRVAKTGPRDWAFMLHSPDPGVDVLAIPSYGKLRVEAVVVPCASEEEAGESPAPPLPWTRERAVRSGQPACAFARLVGDSGATIHPVRSFDFAIELCEDQACANSSAMQPDADGSFNAQLGVLAKGRHERWFRAHDGALARPVHARRAIQSTAFGIATVTRADNPGVPIDHVDLGALPQPVPTVLTLQYTGSFPEGGEAEVRCRVAGDAGVADLLGGELPCLRCVPKPASVSLQDPFTVQVEVLAESFCPLLEEQAKSRSAGAEGPLELPVALDIVVAGKGSAASIGERRLSLTGTLRQAVVSLQTIEVTGGSDATARVEFPSPINSKVALSLEPGDALQALLDDGALTVELAETELRIVGQPGELASVELRAEARDCCSAGEYPLVLHVRETADGSNSDIQIPVRVTVVKPRFWVCPGKTIAKIAAGVLTLGFLFWLIRGFTSPPTFAKAAVLARAESHAALSKINEGDEDWRLLRSLETTKRAFYKPATVHLGGPKAALPSLRGLSDDTYIEARGHGNATLVVEAEGIETFKESSGWVPASVGEHPIGSTVVLRRDDTYLMFRR